MVSKELQAFLEAHGFDKPHQLKVVGDSTNSPMREAITNNLPDFVLELLENGAPVHEKCDGDLCPLALAARYCRPKICEIILSFGANVDFIPEQSEPERTWIFGRRTPLHLAARSICVIFERPQNFKSDAIATINLLLDNGADINSLDDEQTTILFGDFALGSLEMTQLLLKRGINIHARNVDGDTVLQDLFSDFAPILFYKNPFNNSPKQIEISEHGRPPPDIDAVRELAAVLIQHQLRKRCMI